MMNTGFVDQLTAKKEIDKWKSKYSKIRLKGEKIRINIKRVNKNEFNTHGMCLKPSVSTLI